MTDIVCRIIAGELPAEVVVRTPEVIAFLDHRPVFKGHVLICPIRHVPTLVDLPEDLMTPLMSTAQRVAAAMGTALGAEGTFVAMNNVISQSVPHLHLHVVPRRKGDGLRGFFWPRTRYAAGEEAEYAERLRAGLMVAPELPVHPRSSSVVPASPDLAPPAGSSPDPSTTVADGPDSPRSSPPSPYSTPPDAG